MAFEVERDLAAQIAAALERTTRLEVAVRGSLGLRELELQTCWRCDGTKEAAQTLAEVACARLLAARLAEIIRATRETARSPRRVVVERFKRIVAAWDLEGESLVRRAKIGQLTGAEARVYAPTISRARNAIHRATTSATDREMRHHLDRVETTLGAAFQALSHTTR